MVSEEADTLYEVVDGARSREEQSLLCLGSCRVLDVPRSS